jgi:hypothetical protein
MLRLRPSRYLARAKALESLLRNDVVGRVHELPVLSFSALGVALFLFCNS